VESRIGKNLSLPSTFNIQNMDETITIREEKFFRPKRMREERGRGRFQDILKKAIRAAFRLLLLFLLLFVGHSVYVHLLEDPIFRVREFEVEGNRKISEETVLSLAEIEGMPNLFTLRLKEVAKRLESHPWVDQVRVRKVFPNKIAVQIEEREPVAILPLEELYYIDTKGVIFATVGDADAYNYPFLTGLTRQALEKDPVEAKHLITKALEFLRIVDKERIFPPEEISEIHMEKIDGIEYFTKTEGLEVKMGWEQFGEKLRRLSVILSDLQKRKLSAVSIDCSDLKRMVVQGSADEKILDAKKETRSNYKSQNPNGSKKRKLKI
jgi:cell division protein FtsQ